MISGCYENVFRRVFDLFNINRVFDSFNINYNYFLATCLLSYIIKSFPRSSRIRPVPPALRICLQTNFHKQFNDPTRTRFISGLLRPLTCPKFGVPVSFYNDRRGRRRRNVIGYLPKREKAIGEDTRRLGARVAVGAVLLRPLICRLHRHH